MLTLLAVVVTLLSLVNGQEYKNIGRPCWNGCRKEGSCPGYCGSKGFCCRGITPKPNIGCFSWMGRKYRHACARQSKTGPNGIINEGVDCWNMCGKKAGPCARGFCGTGICKQVGTKYVCAQASAPTAPLQNIGKGCIGQCGGKPGKCNYCGSQGYCCRSNTAKKDGNGCVKGMGGPWTYLCAKKLTPAPTLPWPKNEWTIPCPKYNDIPRAPLKPGVSYKKLVCDMLALMNKDRREWPKSRGGPLKPYCFNSKLMRAAKINSYACAQCGKMNHIPWNVGCRYYYPAFGGPAKRIQRCGYKRGGGIAEALAGGSTANTAFMMWKNEFLHSKPPFQTNNHYGLVVNPDRVHVGIAAEARDGGTNGLIWTAVTARPRKWGTKEVCDMQGWCDKPGEGFPSIMEENADDEFDMEEMAESQEIITSGAEAPLP